MIATPNGRLIGMRISELLAKNGKNQSDLAKALDLNKSTISTWISGLRCPSRENAARLGQYFIFTDSQYVI